MGTRWIVLRRHSLLVIVLFVGLAGTAWAVTDRTAKGAKGTKTYYACVTKAFHTLNLTTKKAKCRPGQRKISFNAAGPRGLTGPAGKAGAAGAKGAAGHGGATGASGSAGAAGPAGAKGDQ